MVKENKYVNPKEVWSTALGCVVESGLPDVGEVVANSQTLKDHVQLAANGSEEERAAVLPRLKLVLKPQDESVPVYVRVAMPDPNQEMATFIIEAKEAGEEVLERIKHVPWTRENLLLFMQDLDALTKMYAGFAIDCAKKFDVFEVPYLEDCKKNLGVAFRYYSADNFGMELLKAKSEEDLQKLIAKEGAKVLSNGLAILRHPKRQKLMAKRGKKQVLLDPISQCLEEAMDRVGEELTSFVEGLELPKFSPVTKKYLVNAIEKDETFYSEFVLMKYYLQVWTSMMNWKQKELSRVRRENGGKLDPDQEAAIKGAVSPAFKALEADIRRGIQFLAYLISGKSFKPQYVAGVALAASYYSNKGQWVADEAFAKNFAVTALVAEFNGLLYSQRKQAGDKVTEYETAEIDAELSFGYEIGMTLTFENGKAEIMDDDLNLVGLVTLDEIHHEDNHQLSGSGWEVCEENGHLYVRKPVVNGLDDQIPDVDETRRVFISSNGREDSKDSNTLGKAMLEAQAMGKDVYLVKAANGMGNAGGIPQAVVVGDEIVGRYRTPFVRKGKTERGADYRQAIVETIGCVKGKVERVFTYFDKEEGWVTITELGKCSCLSGKDLFPKNLKNRMKLDVQKEEDKRKAMLAERRQATKERSAGIDL